MPTISASTATTSDLDLRTAVARRVAADPDLAAAPADRTVLRRAVARALAAEGVVLAPDRWARLVRDLVDGLGGLGPVEALLRDPAVTDVMINGPAEIWIERSGQVVRTDAAFADTDALLQALRRVLGPLGVRLDHAHPWADAVLPGGIRLHAMLAPLASAVTVTLRRVPAVLPSWSDLEATGSVPAEARELLCRLVRQRRNVLVAGQAGVGKTTLLARLLGEVGNDRVVVIEDTPELQPPCPHVVQLRVRAASPDGRAGVTATDLLRNALRMRPDRLVVGEVRGREVADMLQACNTGHAGSMATVHANGPADALVRIEGMALMAGIPLAAVRAQIASAIDVVVTLRRGPDGSRQLAAINEVVASPDGPAVEHRWSAR